MKHELFETDRLQLHLQTMSVQSRTCLLVSGVWLLSCVAMYMLTRSLLERTQHQMATQFRTVESVLGTLHRDVQGLAPFADQNRAACVQQIEQKTTTLLEEIDFRARQLQQDDRAGAANNEKLRERLEAAQRDAWQTTQKELSVAFDALRQTVEQSGKDFQRSLTDGVSAANARCSSSLSGVEQALQQLQTALPSSSSRQQAQQTQQTPVRQTGSAGAMRRFALVTLTRSGSSWLTSLLGSHPRMSTVMEPLDEDVRPIQREREFRVLCTSCSSNAMLQLLRRTRLRACSIGSIRRYRRRSRNSTLVESN